MTQNKSSSKTPRRRASVTRSAAPLNTPAPPAESDRDRLEWVLDFLRTPLLSLRHGQLLDLREDAGHFLKPYRVEPNAGQEHESLPAGMMELGVLKLVRGGLANGIRNWEKKGRWNVFDRPPDITFVGHSEHFSFQSPSPPEYVYVRRPDGTAERRLTGAVSTLLIVAAAELLMQWWPRLRRCRHCKELFLPTHGRQRYHDPVCAAQARSAKAAAGKRPRDYHEEYKKRLKKQQGDEFKPPQRRGPRRPT